MKISEVTDNPLPAEFFLATPTRRYERIKIEGLVPSAASHPGRPPGVYLTDQIGLAVHYAEMNFGEEESQSWVILSVNSSTLDPEKFGPDCGHETQMEMREIIALGYTREQVYAWQIPWWVSLRVAHQVIYHGAISPNQIRIVQELP